MKLKRRKKSSRDRGRRTCGFSAKLHKGKGNKGGKGMSGTGKRADQKKSLVIKLYGNKYFGKQGETSRRAKKKGVKIINLSEIAKSKPGELDLSKYKILGEGEIKGKYIIKAKTASKSAIEKVKQAGGEIIIKIQKKREVKEIKKDEKTKAEKKKEQKALKTLPN
jgi:large subunit ribosomal protein L15